MNPKYYEIGLRELGTTEVAGSKHNPRIIEYHKATGLAASEDEVPWCGSFVAWCMAQAGIGYNKTYAARARSWLDWGKEIKWKMTEKHIDDVPVGAVGVIPRGKAGSGQGHVFMFHAWVDGTDRKEFWALEGNASNRVQIGKHRTSEVLGWRWSDELPFPVANQSLPSSGIIKAAGGALTAAAVAVAGSSSEIIGAVQQAKTISAGSLVGTFAGILVVVAVIAVVILRARQKKDEKKIGSSQAE